LATRLALLIAAATVIAAGAGTYLLLTAPSASTGGATTIQGVACASYSTSYTVLATNSGYNDSIHHGVPRNHWPILCAHQGDVIEITVLNRDSVEPHGVAIEHYDEAGVTVPPGHSITIRVVANERGYFQIFCNVICAVHPYMLSGLLVVTS